MNIHYLSLSKIPSQTANSVHVMKMSAAFAKLGHEVTLHALKGKKSIDPYDSYATPKSFDLALSYEVDIPKIGIASYALQSLWKLHFTSKNKADLVYARDPFTVLLAAMLGYKVALELHNIPEKDIWIKVVKKLLTYPQCLGLVTITESLKRDVATLFKVAEERILVAADAADDPNVKERKNKTNKVCVGYVGSLYKGRGIEQILTYAKACPELDFLIIGGNDKEIAYFNRHEIFSNVHYTGYVSQAELSKYYAQMDIMLAPYQQKVAVHGNTGNTCAYMSPLKIFEYMSYAKPIIATNLPALLEVKKISDYCLMPELGDDKTWIESIKLLATNESLRKSMGETAYLVFQENYTWNQRAAKILQWIEKNIIHI